MWCVSDYTGGMAQAVQYWKGYVERFCVRMRGKQVPIYLFHEDFFERLQLFRRVLVLWRMPVQCRRQEKSTDSAVIDGIA